MFQSDPIKSGPLGLRYTILDLRKKRVTIPSVTWAERFPHAPSAGRFLPQGSLGTSTVGLLVMVVTGTFAIQDAGSRLVTTFAPTSSAFRIAIQLFGLFGPLLLIGQCASCRCDFANVEPAPDECIVCPECGAAWKIRPVDANPVQDRAA